MTIQKAIVNLTSAVREVFGGGGSSSGGGGSVDVSGKLDIYQGTANSGKIMTVDTDGKVKPKPKPTYNDKVNVNQGASNANRFMMTDENGMVKPVDISTWTWGEY